ncbi:tubulin binding cofactor A [Xylariomycetidae sp. FL0641]|nr:tubulin binding cofactor A [Xylariomycetidae sp. FL0641]
MPAPSPLTVATQAVQRLLKEEKSYEKELAQQSARVAKLEAEAKSHQTGGGAEDGNAEFVLKQEQRAMAETQAVFAPLRERIVDAVQRLEEQVAAAESEGGAPADEVAKAKEALKLGQGVEPPVA